MAVNWNMVLRAQQILFAVIVLGLSAYVVNWYTMETRTASPKQVNLLVAAPVISLVSIAAVETVSRLASAPFFMPVIVVAIEGINALLYFAGFIALAVFLNGLLFCRGNVCGSARAATAFSALSFGAWAASAALTAMTLIKGGLRRAPNPRTQAMYAAEMKDAASRA